MSHSNEHLEKVIEVFSDHPFEKPLKLFEKDISVSSLVIFDGDEVKKAFEGHTWQATIHDPYSILGTFDKGLKFPRDFLAILSEQALLYYLPLFLSAITISPEEADVLIDSMISKFESKSLFNQLSEAQQKVYKEVMGAY